MDRRKTLDELDPPAWGEAAYDSRLVETCHRLRKKPVSEFTVEDLRIMIGQGIGLHCLVPIAVEVLERDPLAAGDFYPGDLLRVVLRVPADFWNEKQGLRIRVEALLKDVAEVPRQLHEAVKAFHGGVV